LKDDKLAIKIITFKESLENKRVTKKEWLQEKIEELIDFKTGTLR